MDLLLLNGRARDVLLWLTPDHRATLGALPYLLARAQASGAIGDYSEYDSLMTEVRGLLIHSSQSQIGPQAEAAIAIGRAIGMGAIVPLLHSDQLQAGFARNAALSQTNRAANELAQAAKADVLRGIIQVERGDVRDAEQLLQDALKIWGSPHAVERGAGFDFPGRTIADDMLAMIRREKRK